MSVGAQVDRAPRPCHHKIAQHEHGTYVAYKLDHCRCHACVNANTEYVRGLVRRIAYGRPAYVPTAPAVAHIRALQTAGLGWKRIAHLAGLDSSAVYPLLYGRPDRNGGQPRTKARPETVAAILAVPMPSLDDLGSAVGVPAVGTARRLRALVAAGWSVSQVAARIPDGDRQALDDAIGGVLTVTALTARRVRDVYAQLENLAPPERTIGERGAASRARRRAERAGWLAPAWWDADTIDDPGHTPDTSTTHGVAARLDDYVLLVRTGEQPDCAARRCGWASRAEVEVTARRHERLDVLDAITRWRAVA